MVYPIGPLKIVTEEDCEKAIKELQETGEILKDTINSQKVLQRTGCKIDVWKRILFHVKNGRIITIDSSEQVQLWDDVPTKQ